MKLLHRISLRLSLSTWIALMWLAGPAYALDIVDPPVSNGIEDYSVLEDAAPTVIDLFATFDDPEDADADLSFSIVENTNAAAVSLSIDEVLGTLTVTYLANQNGASTVTIRATDTEALTVDETFTVTIDPVNDQPSFTSGGNQTADQTSGPQTVISWATDVSAGPNEDVQALTFNVSTDNTALFSAQPSISSDGTLTYTPESNAVGIATITVSLSDDGGTTNGGDDESPSSTFTITVNSVNDAPTTSGIEDITVPEDTPSSSIDLFAAFDDTEDPDEALSYEVFSNSNPALFSSTPIDGTAGTLTLNYALNASGSAELIVRATDTEGLSVDAPFTVTVTEVNDAPTTPGIANVQDLEDGPARVVDLFAAFDDIEDADNQLTYTVESNSNPEIFDGDPVVDGAAGTLTLNYASDANGTSSLTVRATDTGGLFVDATFTVGVQPVNDAPSFTKGPDVTVPEDSPPQTVPAWATDILPGPENEANQLVQFIVTNNNNTLFAAQPTIASDGTLSFTPAAEEEGIATVTVVAQDNGGVENGGVNVSPEATFIITITGANDPPVAVNDAYNVPEGQSLIASAGGSPPGVLDNDSDPEGDNLTATVIQPPQHAATWSFNTNGSFVYVHDGSENVLDSLTYVANDGQVNSNIATVLINIRETNDPPIAGNIADVTVLEDAPNTLVSLFSAFDDPDDPDNTLVFTIENNTNPALFANLAIDPTTGNLSLDYLGDANGEATLTVQAMDPGGLTAQTSFKVSVTAVNDAPTMVPGDNIVLDEDSGPQTFANWATGISAGPANESNQTVTVSVSNSNAALFSSQPVLNVSGSNGTLVFTPAPETSGQATVTIALNDNGGIQNGGVSSSSYEFLITITGDNDPPSSAGIADIQPLEDSGNITYNLFEVFDDVEDADEDLAFSLPNGFDDNLFSAVTISGNPAILTIDLAEDAWGSTTLVVRATDTEGLWVEESFVVDIQPINDAPSFTEGGDIVLPQNSPAQTIEDWATDISPGAANESDQVLGFTVTNDNEVLFGQQPAIAPDGTLTFAPAIGDQVFGEAVVTVILSDNGGTENGGIDQSEPITFTINIKRFNTAPIANNDNYIVDQGATLTVNATIGVLANDSDTENDPLSVQLVDGPSNASSFTLNEDGSFAYTHDNSATLTDAFTYMSSDGFDDSNIATATISINPLGTLSLSDVTVLEDAEDTVLDVRAAMSLSQAGGHKFVLTNVTNPSLFESAEIDSLTGMLILSYAANQHGTSSMTIVATPAIGDDISAAQRVNVLPLNDVPIAVDDAAATIANRPIEIDVQSNDVDFDGDNLIIRTFSTPDIGTVEPQFNGRFLYTPEQDFTGQASFTYTISDDSLATDMGQVTITVFSGRFNVAELSAPGSVASAAYSISNVGEAVGVSQAGNGMVMAFSSSRNLPSHTPGEALDANDFGHIVGSLAVPRLDADGLTFHAARWDSADTFILGAFDGRSSKAYGINNEGQIIGVSTAGESEFLHAFLWEGEELIRLESELTEESQAFAINEQGQSVGYVGGNAVIWTGDRLESRLTGSAGRAYGLNDRGQVVGSIDNGAVQAVFWNDNGVQQILGEGNTFSEAYGINNASWIVGTYTSSAAKTSSTNHPKPVRLATRPVFTGVSDAPAKNDEASQHHRLLANDHLRAFLWQGDTMVDLNDFIDAGSGWTLLEARAINNAAQIAGIGLFDGQRRAFLLSPTTNKSPTANHDAVNLSFIAPTTIDVLGNDLDADGDTLRVVAITQGNAGLVELAGDTEIIYTPAPHFAGKDQFTYTISDGQGGSAVAEVVIRIDESALPETFQLEQNFPNPFNPTTTISLALPEQTHVRLEIYNMLGQRVRTLIDGVRPAGAHRVTFDASDLPGGAYMYRASAGDWSESRKMVVR